MSAAQLLPGVDKLVLYTNDFGVDNYDLILRKNQTTGPGEDICDLPLLLTDSRGKILRATKAWAETKDRAMPYQVDFNRHGMIVAFNPSKALHPWMLNTDVDSVCEFMSAVHRDCKDLGIHFDLGSCRISRMDLAKQPLMDHNLAMYQPTYDIMGGSRKKKQMYPNGALWYTKESEFGIYDKAAESRISTIQGLLRGESRLKKADVVSKFMGINYVNDFVKTDAYVWNEAYNKHIKEMVFNKWQGDLFVIDLNQEVERLRQVAAVTKKNIGITYLSLHGVQHFINNCGGIDKLKQIIEESGVLKTRAKNEFIKHIEENLLPLVPKGDGVTVIELINELKLKFAA